jgi:hypothetical protein
MTYQMKKPKLKPKNLPRRNDRAYDVLRRLAEKMDTDFDTLIGVLEELIEDENEDAKEDDAPFDLDEIRKWKENIPTIPSEKWDQVFGKEEAWREGFEDVPDLVPEEIREIEAASKVRAIKKYWMRTKGNGVSLMKAQRFVEAYERHHKANVRSEMVQRYGQDNFDEIIEQEI